MDPSTWQGAAYQMGNSPQTWQLHYNPLQRAREMQGAVETNAALIERMREGAQDEEPIEPIMVVRELKRRRRGEY